MQKEQSNWSCIIYITWVCWCICVLISVQNEHCTPCCPSLRLIIMIEIHIYAQNMSLASMCLSASMNVTRTHAKLNRLLDCMNHQQIKSDEHSERASEGEWTRVTLPHRSSFRNWCSHLFEHLFVMVFSFPSLAALTNYFAPSLCRRSTTHSFSCRITGTGDSLWKKKPSYSECHFSVAFHNISYVFFSSYIFCSFKLLFNLESVRCDELLLMLLSDAVVCRRCTSESLTRFP